MSAIGSCVKSVLNNGLKVDTTIRRVPYLDRIAPVEEIALRWEVRQALEKTKPSK